MLIISNFSSASLHLVCITAFIDCIEPGDIAHCQNGGTCRINLLTRSRSCVCPSAYIGDACEHGASKSIAVYKLRRFILYNIEKI